MVIYDGQEYQSQDDVPDFGSIRCITSSGMIRNYEGLSKDVSKLPKYVSTGSSFLCYDTGDYYKFEDTTKQWYKM